MLYNDLTQEQKDALAAYERLLREWTMRQAQNNNRADAVNTQYNANVSAILASLDAGEIIPNSSGLDGAVSLTKEDLITVTSHVQNMLTNMSTHTSGFNTAFLRQVWVKFGGAVNMLGG